jgi:hypothetical protein
MKHHEIRCDFMKFLFWIKLAAPLASGGTEH